MIKKSGTQRVTTLSTATSSIVTSSSLTVDSSTNSSMASLPRKFTTVLSTNHPRSVWGKVLDAGQGTVNGKSNAAMETDWQMAVTEAAEVAKQRGKLPGNIASFISDIISPKVDWRSVLWPFFTNLSNEDYSWRKPHRGYISEDEYLPSMYNEGCGRCFRH